MKKLFILSFASILMLTGCGATETLSCTYKTDANNGSTKVSYDIDHEQDEIKKVRITYDYNFDNNNGNNGNTGRNVDTNNNTNNNDNDAELNDITDNNNVNTNNDIDGVGTGTDGTTNDSQIDDDGIVDGVVGSAIDTIVGGVTGLILDSAGLRDRHATVQNTYGNVTGFSVQNTNDVDNNYTVTYVIDYDTISDNDLARFNLSRDLDEMRENYVNQGFTCR
ncbi:MAG: hypothetical protein IJE89_05155 [Bacilli bacterium]|nr:hypothetical protein [Bacilli bacterium]